MNTVHLIVAGCIGIITMIVSIVALRHHSTFGRAAIPIGICCGLLSMVGISDLGSSWSSGLLIPWQALGIAVTLLFLLMFLGGVWRFVAGIRGRGYVDPSKKWKKQKKDHLPEKSQPHGVFKPPIGALRATDETNP